MDQTPLSRRHFIKGAGAVTLGFSGLLSLLARGSYADELNAAKVGYGPLIPDPQKVFDLPKGFSYKVISRGGQPMGDGFITPGCPDGMAAFPGPGGKTLIVRNHELDAESPELGPWQKSNELFGQVNPEEVYDPGNEIIRCVAGTTTLVYDTKTQQLEDVFLSLAGTLRNCAGGPTPWNSWITCEESVLTANGILQKDHGYCFEVPASRIRGLAAPAPLLEMGRFNHEAVAVDPKSGIVYQTEDRVDGLIYRYVPKQPGKLAKGGKLQALAIKGQKSLDTRNWEAQTVVQSSTREVEWIDMTNVQSPGDTLRAEGFERGAARFARGEGMWYGNGAVFFACTNGGKKTLGQIWKYTPSPREGTPDEASKPGKLELFVEPNDPGLIENADNLTVAPWGDLVVCEDGAGDQRLVGITPAGKIYQLGRNALNTSELAGSTFSPDGSTLFVNIQKAHMTLAITGPWQA